MITIYRQEGIFVPLVDIIDHIWTTRGSFMSRRIRPGVKCQEAICEHLDEQGGPLLGNTNYAGAPSYTTHVCAAHLREPAILSLRHGLVAAGRRPPARAAASCAPPFSADTRRPAPGERP